MGLNLDMTLREFFELSERMAAAARVIRESQAALGGAHSNIAPSAIVPLSPGEVRFVPAIPTPQASPSAIQWSPEEQALRARLKAEREAAAEKAVLESRS